MPIFSGVAASLRANPWAAPPCALRLTCISRICTIPRPFKTHNRDIPKRLTSSRSIENAPARSLRSAPEDVSAGAFPIQP